MRDLHQKNLKLVLVFSYLAGPAFCLAAQETPPPAASQPASQPAEWKTTQELWYSMELAGAKTGSVAISVKTNGSQFRTMTSTKMKIGRGDTPIEIEMSASFTETAQGKPVLVQSTQNMSKQVTESQWTFTDKDVQVLTRQGGRETTTTEPLPEGDWLTPVKAEAYFDAQAKAGATEITYRMVTPEMGLKPMGMKHVRLGEEDIQILDSIITVSIWKSTTDPATIESTEKRGPDGRMVYQEANTGIGKVVTRLEKREDVEGVDVGAGPEIMLNSFVKPDKPIENAMKATQAKLRLRMKQGKMPNIPTAAAQRVEADADGTSAVLTIDINNNVPATSEELTDKNYLASTVMIDLTDDLVQKIAKRGVLEAGADPMQRAEALRKTVNKHISKKGMATAFASASETARTKSGDCSEHGVLLCALLRANDIPARVASGLVYFDEFGGAEGSFGWHMWTQGLIDGKWVDFDATLPTRYSAGHVLTSTSALTEGLAMSDLTSMLQLIGNIEIDIMDVKYD